MYRFESDYLEGCHPAILERLQNTNLEQTLGYGEDPHCQRAAEIIKEACNCPEAQVHFLVGGTQTNATVISSILRPHQGVLCSDAGHIAVHETGAIEHSGHKVLTLPSENGKIAAWQIDEAMEAHYNDFSREHMVQPGMVYISYPTELGTLYTKQELLDIRDSCRRWEMPLFIDGARLGYGLASAACDIRMDDLPQIADVFYIGGTKQGALFGEAVVFNNISLSNNFRYNIKQNGGMLAKGRLLGIQFETLFDGWLYLDLARRADERAQIITNAFKAKGIEMLVDSPTNQVFPILTDEQLYTLAKDFGFEKWQKVDEDLTAVRFCTSWATDDEAVHALIDAIQNL